MKRYIRSTTDDLELNIMINYVLNSSPFEIAATEFRPVTKDWDNEIIDEKAKENYSVFVSNAFEIIEAYDFEIFDQYQHTSKTFPYTSEYRWVAHRSEIDADNVPKLIRLRISEHTQKLSPSHVSELSKKLKEQAQTLKRPKTKKVQRYVVESISVNELKCNTYEEALHKIEMIVRSWLEKRGIDVSVYGDPVW